LLAFFWQRFAEACHCPPAFSQSAFVLWTDMSPEGAGLVEGLADGELVLGLVLGAGWVEGVDVPPGEGLGVLGV
jgi:hypothetical protein